MKEKEILQLIEKTEKGIELVEQSLKQLTEIVLSLQRRTEVNYSLIAKQERFGSIQKAGFFFACGAIGMFILLLLYSLLA